MFLSLPRKTIHVPFMDMNTKSHVKYAGSSRATPDSGNTTAMDGRFYGVLIVPLVISITGISVLTLLLLLHLPLRSSDNYRYFKDSCDCRHQCEWQLDLMNKTFNTLLAIQEEKIRKLHQSDMSMALIREQLHKEMLELFLYEYQTMNHRLKNIKIDSVPQFCSNWCTNMDFSKCKENVVKLQNENQRLLERERKLLFRTQRLWHPDLSQSQICVEQNKLKVGSIIIPLLIIILVIQTGLLSITMEHMRKSWIRKQHIHYIHEEDVEANYDHNIIIMLLHSLLSSPLPCHMYM